MLSPSELKTIHSAAWWAEIRMRIGRAVAALPVAMLCALGASAVILVVRKVLPDRLSERGARWLLVAVACALLGVVVVALGRRLAPLAGAIALDRHHGLRGRLPNALEFVGKPVAGQQALVAAAIDDACQHAQGLSPRRAVPIPWPHNAGLTLLVALAVAGLAVLEVHRPAVPQAPPPVAELDPLVMPPDDVELFKQVLEELKREEHSPEVQAAIERFNALVEDIANRRLNRSEAFRRMEEIERALMEGREASSMALEEALKETAAELKKSELSEPVAKALEQKQLAEAEKQLKQLADSLRRKGKKKADDKELERLRKALQEAAAKKKEALEAVNEKRAELRKDLLKKKREQPDGGAPEDEEQKLLEKKERELERLDRESERREQAGRALSKLDRDLAKAAEDLMRDLGEAAKDLEQAAEDINRLEQQEMSDKEKEELRQRLEELRELIRQQGQGGQKRLARLMRFGQKARGQGGRPGEGQRDRDGQGKEQGQLRPGGEGADGEEKMLVLGPGGQPIPMPGQGSEGSGSQGSEGREQGGQPGQPGGKGIGKDPGGDPMGKKATDPKMSTQDVEAEGLDNKQGATNAEVILAAADRGFAGRPYKKVYREYRTVAEDQINKEDIPDGFRFYVRRYFQLIRPRE
jgi:hypothetical protein